MEKGPRNRKKHRQQGFSLIEVMIVVAIIGVLAGVIMLNLSRARTKGRTGKAEADLAQVRTAIGLLESDTGKWPNGCPPTEENTTSVALNEPAAALVEAPVVGTVSGTCEWQQEQVDHWSGPYGSITDDPWGRPYVFNSHYLTHCDGGTPVYNSVVLTLGENGAAQEPFDSSCNLQDTDDIFILLK